MAGRPGPVVAKVRDFRGFAGNHPVDIDADIVLLAGPNGYGKTSLLEGLLLLLTGWHDPAISAVDLISREPGSGGRRGEAKKQFVLEASVEMQDGRLEDLYLSWDRNGDGQHPVPMPKGLPK